MVILFNEGTKLPKTSWSYVKKVIQFQNQPNN